MQDLPSTIPKQVSQDELLAHMQARHRAELDALLKEMQGATASHEEETQQLVLLTSLDSTLVAEGVVDSPGESVDYDWMLPSQTDTALPATGDDTLIDRFMEMPILRCDQTEQALPSRESPTYTVTTRSYSGLKSSLYFGISIDLSHYTNSYLDTSSTPPNNSPIPNINFSNDTEQLRSFTVKAVHTHAADNDEELSFLAGDEILVWSEVGDGWFFGQVGSQFGNLLVSNCATVPVEAAHSIDLVVDQNEYHLLQADATLPSFEAEISQTPQHLILASSPSPSPPSNKRSRLTTDDQSGSNKKQRKVKPITGRAALEILGPRWEVSDNFDYNKGRYECTRKSCTERNETAQLKSELDGRERRYFGWYTGS